MKKISFLLIALGINFTTYAYDFQVGDLCYSIISTEDRTVSVEASSQSISGDIVIPSIVNYCGVDFTVISIAHEGFAYCKGITSFTIPNTITFIGEYGFGWCWYLNTIILDNPPKDFDAYSTSFNFDWRDFKTVKIINCNEKEIVNNGVGILRYLPEHELYINGNKVKDYKIADGVTAINSCFQNCNSIKSLDMPNSVKTIAPSAFYYCTSLKSITLSSAIGLIENNAFGECPELREIYVKSIEPAKIDQYAFPNGAYMFATVYVPKGTKAKYTKATVWKQFENIEEKEYEDVTEVPEPPKCEKPAISFSNNKLLFTCETEGAECVVNISNEDIKTHYGNEINLTATYLISAYAIAEGYEDSDVINATLCWLDTNPQTDGIVSDLVSVRGEPVLIQNYDGNISLTGLKEGALVSVYSISGHMIGNYYSSGNQASIATNLRKGEIAIITIGEKSVKIIMR